MVDVTLDVSLGEVFGIAGPNGAGKSTLIALLLGFLKPTSGTLRVGGYGPRAFVERFGVGYLSELVTIPPRWRLEEALSRYALLAGVEPGRVQSRVRELVDRLGLEEHWGKQIRQLSKGNLQRVGLAQALLHNEQLLILDEPTHGLDPLWTQRFRDLVGELRSPERVILIASHNLDELQRIADRVAIIDHGRVQRVVQTRGGGGTTVSTPYRLVLAGDIRKVSDLLRDSTEASPNEFELPPLSLDALNALLRAVLDRGVQIVTVAPLFSSLEQQFREAVDEAGGPEGMR